MHVVEILDDLDVSNAFFAYTARYLFDPQTNVIRTTRSLEAHFGKQVCMPQDFLAALPTLKKIERDSQAQIIVKPLAKR